MPEATLNRTENGLVPQGEGWYVLNAQDAKWIHVGGLGSYCGFEARRTSWCLPAKRC
jgi:hypothetical protein